MSFVDKANSLFPGREWNGRSSIHVSVCYDIAIPESKKNSPKLFKLIFQSGLPDALYNWLTSKFPADEWLLTLDQFRALFMADMNRCLNDQMPTESPNKLVNPSTHNRFHRLMLRSDVVGGIRFWAGDQDYMFENEERDGTNLGWRFRIESTGTSEGEKQKTREIALERVRQAEEECVPILVAMEEAPEVPLLALQEVQKKIRLLELA